MWAQSTLEGRGRNKCRVVYMIPCVSSMVPVQRRIARHKRIGHVGLLGLSGTGKRHVYG